jgi:cell pole-organizing protein PopZ
MSPLDRARAIWSRNVDMQAEAARLAWITPGNGQMAVYLMKREEAARFASDPAPNPAAYPLLSAEVNVTAPTLAEVAAIVTAMAAAWIAAAAAIETIRLGAKAEIAAAETVEAVIAAASVSFPHP